MTESNPQSEQNTTPEDVATLYSWANLHGAKYRDFSASRAQTREITRLRVEQAAQEAETLRRQHGEPAAAGQADHAEMGGQSLAERELAEQEVAGQGPAEQGLVEQEAAEAEMRAQQEQAAQERAQEEQAAAERAAEEHSAAQKAVDDLAAQQRAEQQRISDERAAEQRAAEEKAAELRAAEQHAAEQQAFKQRADEQREAEQRAEELRMAAVRARQEEQEAAAEAERRAAWERHRAAEQAARQAAEEARRAAEELAHREALLAAQEAADRNARMEAEKAAEQAMAEEAARAARETKERAAELARQQAAELAAKQAEELAAQQAAEAAAKKAAEEAQKQVEELAARQAAEQAAKEANEMAERLAAEQAAQEAAELEAKQAAEQAVRQAAEQTRRHASLLAAQQAAERAAEYAAQQVAQQRAWRRPADNVAPVQHSVFAPAPAQDFASVARAQASRPSMDERVAPELRHTAPVPPAETSPVLDERFVAEIAAPRNPWAAAAEPREAAARPAWLDTESPIAEPPSSSVSSPSASASALPAAASSPAPIFSPAPEDTLQGSRDRMTSRWFALRGVFDGGAVPGSVAPGSPALIEPMQAPSTMRPPALAVFSLAGGVGKTSLVATLGRALSARGERVLMVDTAAFGLLPFFFGATDQRPGVLRTFDPPGVTTDAAVQIVTLDPEGLSSDAMGQSSAQESLAGEIGKFARGAGRVIVDLATASGATTRRIMRMAPMVLVPVIPDMNSVVSVSSIDAFFEQNGNHDGRPALPYYVLNQFDATLPLHLDVREVLGEQLGDRLLPFALRRAPSMSEALAEGMTVIDYAPGSPLAEDFNTLAGWVKSLSAPATASTRGLRWSER